MQHVGHVVLPGDCWNLSEFQDAEVKRKLVLGPGLRMELGTIIVSKPGILKHKSPALLWIDSQQKRYIPVKGERVVGIVTLKAGDIFRVDVGGSEQATLSFLSFEGANKRNRPDVKVGDIVYGRFLVANKDMEPELVCIDGNGKSSGMGIIRDGGFMFHVSLNLVRKCRHPESILMKTLARKLPFESTIGDNGRIWVKGRSEQETIALVNAISSAEYMDNGQIKDMYDRIMDELAGFGPS